MSHDERTSHTHTEALPQGAGHVLFVGAGAMGKALLAQITTQPHSFATITAVDRHQENLDQLAAYNVNGALTLDEAYKTVPEGFDTIFLAIKPQGIPSFLQQEGARFASKVVVSLAAGLTTSALAELLDPTSRIIRIMPNLPVSEGLGMIALSAHQSAGSQDVASVINLLAPCGIVEELPEEKIDIFTVLAGSSPAFFAHIIEMFTREGVRYGLRADLARTCVVQTMLGTASLLAQTKEHPAQLIDRVSSPGGTTIEGIRVLDKDGHALIEQVVRQTYERSQKLGSKEEK